MPASDKNWYSLKKLHLVFAVSSAALLLATLLMMKKDHADEWRDTQTTFDEIQIERNRLALQSITTEEFNNQKKALVAARDAAQKALDKKAEQIEPLEDRINTLAHEFDLAKRADKTQKAFWTKAKADRDLAIRDGYSTDDLIPYLEAVSAEYTKVQVLSSDLEGKTKLLNEAKAKLAEITNEKKIASTKLEALLADFNRVKASQEKLAPEGKFSALKRSIMEWPIIDGFNSHHKIDMIWLPELKLQLGMARVARFDRCITCHRAEDQILAGNKPAYPHGDTGTNNIKDWVAQNKYPHPFATHPNPDLYLTSTSPHPMPVFGCTICHDGQGSGTSFNNASHTPNNPHESKEWAKDHSYASNHYWEYPMQPKRFVESSCLKCHHNVTELGVNPKFGATAPKLNRGFELIKKYGCFGCHEIKGFDGSKQIGPDLRLEPNTVAEAKRIAADPSLVAGQMRKVGPSLRYLSQKTTSPFVASWTKEPKAFRPSTKMPQFFDLTNQTDAHAKNMMPVEIAGITHYLMSKSSANKADLLEPPKDHKPDAANGKKMFSQKGCLACHSHKDFPGANETFGPRLDKVHQKIKPGKEGFKWLYSWVRDPQKYHARSKMPDLFLKPEVASDIAAYLQQGGVGNFKPIEVDEKTLNELTLLFLQSALTKSERDTFMVSRKYPLAPKDIKGDEIELVNSQKGDVTDEQWKQMRLSYVGKRTISRYGCFGCHDIPGFEQARPIGTALQDWGRKDTSKLALEHIAEFLHHHGEADGSSTHERVERAEKQMKAGGYADKKLEEKEMRTAFFYESLHHHGRPGFLWQKLRAPRSYDYEKTEIKRYDERLKMPKFPLKEDEIEDIATFVLGLTADPPAEQFVYHPDKRTADRIEGERLLKKFNCVGCHIIELPKFKYGLPMKTPGQDDGLAGLIGMSKNNITSWLNENQEKLIKGNAVEIPEAIDVVLYNINEFLGEKMTPQQQATKLAKLIETKYQDNRRYDKLNTFFTQHQEVLLAEKLKAADYPEFVKQLLAMKKPQSGNTDEKFVSAADFVNWLVATVSEPHATHNEQFKKLRLLGADTVQIRNLAKSIVDGEYDTDVIAYPDYEFMAYQSSRKELRQLFNKNWAHLDSILNEDKEEGKGLILFAEWIKEIAEDEEALKEFLEDEDHKKVLTQVNMSAILKLGKIIVDMDLDAEELVTPDQEELAESKKNALKRQEIAKLFKKNRNALSKVIGSNVVQFHGVYFGFPNPLDPLIDQENQIDLWETLEVGERLILPGSRLLIPQSRLIEYQPPRGGGFAEWLVDSLIKNKSAENRSDAWQQSPPSLYLEGAKVQTPWLYQFLKEPNQIRFTTTLRMPKFNMSDKEARALANYFSAADGSSYPYQLIQEREPVYIAEQNKKLKPLLGTDDYMTESWNLLNGQVCIGCHSVGGRKFKVDLSPDAKKAAHGPDLFNVQNRLRPEWTKLWISHPTWFTPHTSMLQNFSRAKEVNNHLFKGKADLQLIGVRDALMNYKKMIEEKGKTPPFVDKTPPETKQEK